MTSNRLLITAVVVENRPVREVAATYGVSKSWLYELLARYRREGGPSSSPAPDGRGPTRTRLPSRLWT
jgi:transposase